MKTIKNPVLGAIAGDIIGVPFEWYCRRGLQHPRGFKLFSEDSTFSDDTVMTIAVAEWLLTPPFTQENLIKIMRKWGKNYCNRGYGSLFKNWLFEKNPKPYGSYGNGSAMRVSPIGCVAKSLNETLILAEQSASVTHNHPEGIKGAKCIAEAIWYALRDEKFISSTYNYDISRTPEEIIKSGYRFDSTCQGSVPEAICCFLCSHSYEETIRNAIWLRGDADTQACIAGSIAAAYWGIPIDIADEAVQRLPDEMCNILEDFSGKYYLEL